MNAEGGTQSDVGHRHLQRPPCPRTVAAKAPGRERGSQEEGRCRLVSGRDPVVTGERRWEPGVGRAASEAVRTRAREEVWDGESRQRLPETGLGGEGGGLRPHPG